MSVTKRKEYGSFAVRAYEFGKFKHIATYSNFEDATAADEHYTKTGIILEQGRKHPIVPTFNREYNGHYVDKFYKKQLEKSANRSEAFNKKYGRGMVK